MRKRAVILRRARSADPSPPGRGRVRIFDALLLAGEGMPDTELQRTTPDHA